MKKLFVNPKGNVILKEIKEPFIETKGSLVKTSYCLISSGTELRTIEMAKLWNLSFFSLIKNFLKSEEFRSRFFEEFKKTTFKKFLYFYKLISKGSVNKNFKSASINLSPLGYSCSGLIKESNLKNYNGKDRVACAGSNHAELIYSPKNFTCKVPDNVSLEEASFATLGAIAMHGIHRANIRQGEYVGIIGTGLIGLIVVQLAKISGAYVFAFDLINKKLNIAKKLGADVICNPLYHNSIHKVNEITNGNGLDSIIICASSKTPKPLEDAVDLVRNKGKIVLLGSFPISVDRTKLYNKEADLLISRSYGPGRYDKYYEYNGIDYPEKFVPWTVQRNMEIFLKKISENKIDVKSLISEIIPVEEANLAYKKLLNDPINNLAIILNFTEKNPSIEIIDEKAPRIIQSKKLQIGLIGCGSFAQGNHLPFLMSNPHCKIKAICTEHKKTADFCYKSYHPEYVTTNYKDILKDPEIDTVFIYTRHNTHEKFTIKALKAGKNVYVEKPMGLTMQQCLNVYKTVKETNKLYTIGFNRRYSPLIKITKELLRERDNPIIINYRIANNYIPGNHWLYDPDIGGGPLIGEFCHFTDLVLYLINSQPVEIVGRGGNLSHQNLQVYDSCTALIKFRNGSIANLIYTDLSGPDIPKERIEIFSGESTIIIDDFIKLQTSGFDVGNKLLTEQDKGHKNEMESVIRANLGLKNFLVNVDDALNAMILCFKTIESIKTNKFIKINNDFYE